jgi:gamma-glutamyltranspeptidase/glutathione hydrolase
MGLVTIDGRVRQPGQGAPRPRGFLPSDLIPDAAYVGVPALPAALAAVLGSLGTATLSRSVGPAVSWARANGSERAAVLEAVGKRGGLGLSQESVAVELLAVAGRSVSGLLTPDDLSSVRPALTRCSARSLGSAGILRVPWWSDEAPDGSHVQVVAACDGRGRVAIACYETPVEALSIPSLGLAAPRHAAPVMRGKRRVAPGTPRPAAAPMALRVRGGLMEAAVGVAQAAHGQESVEAILESLEQAIAVSDALLEVESGRPVVLAGVRGAPRAVARG